MIQLGFFINTSRFFVCTSPFCPWHFFSLLREGLNETNGQKFSVKVTISGLRAALRQSLKDRRVICRRYGVTPQQGQTQFRWFGETHDHAIGVCNSPASSHLSRLYMPLNQNGWRNPAHLRRLCPLSSCNFFFPSLLVFLLRSFE